MIRAACLPGPRSRSSDVLYVLYVLYPFYIDSVLMFRGRKTVTPYCIQSCTNSADSKDWSPVYRASSMCPLEHGHLVLRLRVKPGAGGRQSQEGFSAGHTTGRTTWFAAHVGHRVS